MKRCPTLCNPVYWSTIGFPVLHHLLEFDLTHVHWVGDVIQPFHPPLPPTFPALSLSQQLSFPMSQLFTSGSFSFSISPFNEYSGFISFGISLQSKGLKESSPTAQFKSTNYSELSFLYGPTLTSIYEYWKNQLWLYRTLLAMWYLCFLICCPDWS